MKKRLTVMGMLVLSLSAQADDLLSLYRRAAQNDPVIRAARASRDAGHEAESLARANLLPNANLSGNLDYTSQDVQDAPNDDYASNAVSYTHLTLPTNWTV